MDVRYVQALLPCAGKRIATHATGIETAHFHVYTYLIHAGLELDVKNVLNVLREARFADGDWAQLGLQLIDHFDSTTIKADHGKANLCMIDTISQWLVKDTQASWEKLTDAMPKMRGYGEATAAIVREKAGIVHTGMLICIL